ncbi:7311_t:CDS:2 [Acaulospora colombiana]|uniref:7311_t:CDS:1 n=1 Tax=Acaulospora colombiana TaxID=27376 RepID=A0ACA9P2K2_9GLOM|nr:7311_t:CDS:2 [Acaulospora colombiana]
MEDEKPFTLDPPFEDGKESGGPDPATEVVGSQGGDPITASTSKTSTTVQSTKSGSSTISDATAQRTSLEGLISDSDAPPTDSSSEDDANPKSVSDSGKTKSKSKHIRSFSGSGTWASSMMKKLKGIAAGGKDEFRGRPPERISKTKKESKEKQEWATKRLIEGEPIYKYAGIATTATFWRFILEVPVNPDPTKGMRAHYTINKPKTPVHAGYGEQGQTQLLSTTITFHIAPTGSDMRFAAYSCNGFSEGIDPDNFKGEGFESGFDPVWADLLERHEQRPFHALSSRARPNVLMNDQFYRLMKEPELQEYVKLKTSEDKIRYPLTESIIPMVNMLDDHDLIDGFGSYPEPLQRSAFFKQYGVFTIVERIGANLIPIVLALEDTFGSSYSSNLWWILLMEP